MTAPAPDACGVDVEALRQLEKAATPGPWSGKRSRDASGDVGIAAHDVRNVIAECFADMRKRDEHNTAEASANAALIAAARNALPALLDMAEENAELRRERDEARKLAYVPGVWRCAKCDFRLVTSFMNASNGSVSANDTVGQKCPNCNVTMWRVSERDAGNEVVDRWQEEHDLLVASEARADDLAARLAEADRRIAKLEGARQHQRQERRLAAHREVVTWLHEEAERMSDPHAKGILNSAALTVGARAAQLAPPAPPVCKESLHAPDTSSPSTCRADVSMKHDSGDTTEADHG